MRQTGTEVSASCSAALCQWEKAAPAQIIPIFPIEMIIAFKERERGAHTCDVDDDGEKDVCNHDAEIFLRIKKITDHFISKNSLGRDIFALLTFLMTMITHRWDIKGYRGISRDIKSYHGIWRDIKGH